MEEDKKDKKTRFKFSTKIVILIVTAILILGGFGGTYYFYNQYNKTKIMLSNPDVANKAESEELLNKLKKLMLLPSDEEPSIATVLDVEKLKDQPFFANAENGDKVVIYTKSRIAILYSPGKDLIVNVAPVSTDEGSETQTESVKVALYNGTTTTGLTQVAEKSLESQLSSVEVISKNNATRNDYQKSLVVSLTESGNSVSSSIASIIDADSTSLPDGEVAPEGADLLIIIGANYK